MQEWSIELATVAQHYAEQCIFEHNPHRSDQVHLFSYVGENIAITNNPTPDYTQLVHGWYNESRYYDITTGECTDQECLHYTQVPTLVTKIPSFQRISLRGLRKCASDRHTEGHTNQVTAHACRGLSIGVVDHNLFS